MGAGVSRLDCSVPLTPLKPSGTCPSPRESAAGVPISETELLVFGGGASSQNDGAQQYNDVYVLDVQRKHWRMVETTGTVPSPRTGHTATLVDGKVVVFGGCSVGSGYLNDVHELDIRTWEWKEVLACGPIPSPRDKHTATAVGSTLFVWGGFGPKVEDEEESPGSEPSEGASSGSEGEGEMDGGAQFTWFSGLYALDLATRQWSRPEVTGERPSARAAHGACMVGKCMVVFGGRDASGRQADTYTLNTESMGWTRSCGLSGPPARSFHGVAALDSRAMICFGGIGTNGDTFGAPLWLFEVRGGVWMQLAAEGVWPKPRSSFVLSVLGGRTLVVFGGASGDASSTGAPSCLNDVTLADLNPAAAALEDKMKKDMTPMPTAQGVAVGGA